MRGIAVDERERGVAVMGASEGCGDNGALEEMLVLLEGADGGEVFVTHIIVI